MKRYTVKDCRMQAELIAHAMPDHNVELHESYGNHYSLIIGHNTIIHAVGAGVFVDRCHSFRDGLYFGKNL